MTLSKGVKTSVRFIDAVVDIYSGVNMPNYPEELIIAVKWLLHKGITRSGDIARRLEVSPYTVNNIKTLLRKRGEFPEPGGLSKRRKRRKAEKREGGDFITKMFGRGRKA